VFDKDGRIADAGITQRIGSFIEGFAAFLGPQQRQVDTQQGQKWQESQH